MPRMKNQKLVVALLALAIGAVAAACADTTVAPLGPQADAVTLSRAVKPTPSATKTQVTGLRWKTPLDSDVVTSAVIDAAGGQVAVPQLGVRLTVPAGAVQAPTTFQVRALAGNVVAFHFEPSGTQFQVPLLLSQDQRFVDRSTVPNAVVTPFQLGYFASDSDVNRQDGSALVSELRPSIALNIGGDLLFPVWHFSGYIVSWSRH